VIFEECLKRVRATAAADAIRVLWAWIVTPQNKAGLTFAAWSELVRLRRPVRPLSEHPAVAAGRMKRAE
jgi:hypothetical protein